MNKGVLSDIESKLEEIRLEKKTIEERLKKICLQIIKAEAQQSLPLHQELIRTRSLLEIQKNEKDSSIKQLEESIFLLAKDQKSYIKPLSSLAIF